MENPLLIGLSRQMVLERQMDVVANNVANVNTNGFKADNSLFEQYLIPGGADPERRALHTQRRAADQRPGPARHR
jgi:flagellar basal-body rod protein FlgF